MDKDQADRVDSSAGNRVSYTANRKGASNNSGVSGGISDPCSKSVVDNTLGFYSMVVGGSTESYSRWTAGDRVACRRGAKHNRAIYSRRLVMRVDSIGRSSSCEGNRQTWGRERQRDRWSVTKDRQMDVTTWCRETDRWM